MLEYSIARVRDDHFLDALTSISILLLLPFIWLLSSLHDILTCLKQHSDLGFIIVFTLVFLPKLLLILANIWESEWFGLKGLLKIMYSKPLPLAGTLFTRSGAKPLPPLPITGYPQLLWTIFSTVSPPSQSKTSSLYPI